MESHAGSAFIDFRSPPGCCTWKRIWITLNFEGWMMELGEEATLFLWFCVSCRRKSYKFQEINWNWWRRSVSSQGITFFVQFCFVIMRQVLMIGQFDLIAGTEKLHADGNRSAQCLLAMYTIWVKCYNYAKVFFYTASINVWETILMSLSTMTRWRRPALQANPEVSYRVKWETRNKCLCCALFALKKYHYWLMQISMLWLTCGWW